MNFYQKTIGLATIALTLPMLALSQQRAVGLTPVNALLTRNLDANKAHVGEEIRAKLESSTHLADGTKLPAGTLLIGHVVQDNMHRDAKSELTLRFDQADLKDGKVVPVKATLVGISLPAYESDLHAADLGFEWTPGTRQIDQVDALPGVDLHSRVASNNSGVLISSKSDVKLRTDSQLEFAIGPQSGA